MKLLLKKEEEESVEPTAWKMTPQISGSQGLGCLCGSSAWTNHWKTLLFCQAFLKAAYFSKTAPGSIQNQ